MPQKMNWPGSTCQQYAQNFTAMASAKLSSRISRITELVKFDLDRQALNKVILLIVMNKIEIIWSSDSQLV